MAFHTGSGNTAERRSGSKANKEIEIERRIGRIRTAGRGFKDCRHRRTQGSAVYVCIDITVIHTVKRIAFDITSTTPAPSLVQHHHRYQLQLSSLDFVVVSVPLPLTLWAKPHRRAVFLVAVGAGRVFFCSWCGGEFCVLLVFAVGAVWVVYVCCGCRCQLFLLFVWRGGCRAEGRMLFAPAQLYLLDITLFVVIITVDVTHDGYQ